MWILYATAWYFFLTWGGGDLIICAPPHIARTTPKVRMISVKTAIGLPFRQMMCSWQWRSLNLKSLYPPCAKR